MDNRSIRILLVDRQEIVLTGIRLLLERVEGFCVVGEATRGTDALTIAEREQPDIVVLEPDLGPNTDVELVASLLSVAPSARVLILTGTEDSELHIAAVRAGALGVVLKTQPPATLIKAIAKLSAGEAWLDRVTTAQVLSQLSNRRDSKPPDAESQKIARLTRREVEIVALAGQGLKNKQIATHLSISQFTVRHHLTSIFSKLDISDRLELMLYAYRQGLAAPPQRSAKANQRAKVS